MATGMTLTLDVHDKTRGNRLAQWDIDATIYDVIVLDTSTGPVKHGKVGRQMGVSRDAIFDVSFITVDE